MIKSWYITIIEKNDSDEVCYVKDFTFLQNRSFFEDTTIIIPFIGIFILVERTVFYQLF